LAKPNSVAAPKLASVFIPAGPGGGLWYFLIFAAFWLANRRYFPYERLTTMSTIFAWLRSCAALIPFGAYLILPICALSALVGQKGKGQVRVNGGFDLLLALIFSFSRSAWLECHASYLNCRLAIPLNHLPLKEAWLDQCRFINCHNFNFHGADAGGRTGTVGKLKIAVPALTRAIPAAAKSAVKDVVHHPLGSGVERPIWSVCQSRKPGRIAENFFHHKSADRKARCLACCFS